MACNLNRWSVGLISILWFCNTKGGGGVCVCAGSSPEMCIHGLSPNKEAEGFLQLHSPSLPERN